MCDDDQNIENSRPTGYVGLIPAAGFGSRLPALQNAKEMLAVGDENRPVIGHLLDIMAGANVKDVTVVLRPQKTDLTTYLGSDLWAHMQLDLKFTPGTGGVPETVALGLEGVEHRHVAFGFPDILFKPIDALTTMMLKLEAGNSQAVLGLFPTGSPEKSDMVKTDKDGTVVDIEIKPAQTELDRTWVLAVWKPSFSRYLINKVRIDSDALDDSNALPDTDHLGQVFQSAIGDGMPIGTVIFQHGSSLDIGTPDDLALARSWTF
ncbi:MAG: nucleotidyltransferase family protein [Woeseiaceae bacterium]